MGHTKLHALRRLLALFLLAAVVSAVASPSAAETAPSRRCATLEDPTPIRVVATRISCVTANRVARQMLAKLQVAASFNVRVRLANGRRGTFRCRTRSGRVVATCRRAGGSVSIVGR
jgi:hypothetical protein